MNFILLPIATFLILGGLFHFVLKVFVAHSRSSGTPMLDGIIFPQLFIGIGSSIFFRQLSINASGLVVGLIFLAVAIFAYFIAWKLGAPEKRDCDWIAEIVSYHDIAIRIKIFRPAAVSPKFCSRKLLAS